MKTNHSVNSIGDPINRVDGVLKVTGQARYAAEHTHAMPQTPLVGFLVASTSAVGEITHLDTSKAEKAEGVQAVLTHTNAGPLKAFSQPMMKADSPKAVRCLMIPIFAITACLWR